MFSINIRPWRHKIRWIKRRSQDALREECFAPGSFQFVYVDGDHRAPSVLTDAILSFPLLASGGIMIFDDYLLELRNFPGLSTPRIAIDAFLRVFRRRVQVLHKERQVAVKKL
jgi:predicted O-methyltransferase YrrM